MGNSENTKFTRDVWIVEGVDDLKVQFLLIAVQRKQLKKQNQ